MSSIINHSTAQKIIDDIEIHIFEEIFNSDKKILGLIEQNESKDVTRHWRFDNNFQLIEEIDNRPSFWPYSAGWHMSAKPSKKIFKYKYLSNGKLNSINETHDSERETINTTHQFTYPNQSTITEFYKLELNEHLNFDFKITKLMDESNISERNKIIRNYIGDGYIQSNQRHKYVYDEKLKEVNSYFMVNSYPLNNKEIPMQEKLSARTNYNYDSSNRLHRIKEVVYKDGSQKLSRDMTFIYYGQSNKIEKIKLKYGENFTPREIEYNVEYEENGDLKTININGKIYNYIFKR